MRAISSVASVSIHAALGAAFLFGTTRPGRTTPTTVPPTITVFPPADEPREGLDLGGLVSRLPPEPNPPRVSLPAEVLESGASREPLFRATWVSPLAPGGGPIVSTGVGVLGEAGPEVLTGPLPVYPELLRRAGLEGQVVLEAVVDSTGLVKAGTISIISASHPGFVDPARRALLATLFRPARVMGRATPMLVRVPFTFSIR